MFNCFEINHGKKIIILLFNDDIENGGNMLPTTAKLEMYKGDTQTFHFAFNQLKSFNFAQATWAMTIRTSTGAEMPIPADAFMLTEHDDGRWRLSVTVLPNVSAAWDFSRGSYDIQATIDDTQVKTLIRGEFVLIKDVTR